MAETGEQIPQVSKPPVKESRSQTLLKKLGFYELFSRKEERKQERLELTSYGHPDVLKLVRGETPKDNPENPLHRKRKVGVAFLSGGQMGAIGAGPALALGESGMLKNVDGVWMVSAGIPVYLSVECGRGDEGSKIITEDNTSGKFVNLPDNIAKAAIKFLQIFYKGPEEPLIDTASVETSMLRRGIPIESVKQSTRELVAILMRAKDGKPVYKDVRQASSVMQVMKAGIHIPGASAGLSEKLDDGLEYLDGAFADPLPLEEMFRRGYTDVLVVSNEPVAKKGGVLGPLVKFIQARMAAHSGYGYPPDVIANIARNEEKVSEQAEFLQRVINANNPYQRVAVIEPLNNFLINPMETRKNILETAMNNAREFTRNLLTGKVSHNLPPISGKAA